MNETTRTTSMLQRVPVILAVTANSYGLELKANGTRKPQAHGHRRRHDHAKADGKPSAHR
ncbi:hypothetical protein [Ramlibacter sp.]|jgi:hypothetical protein|uniref:hypothetical protein n=1 Tax=Ramlibacter sp. TaxID=1917967 RepID=UPI002FC9AA34